MSSLDDEYVWVTLIGDSNTPAQFQPYIGRVIGFPPDADVLPLPTEPSNYRLAGHLPGYARPALVSPTPWEWIITAPSDALLLAIQKIPGANGFTNPASGQLYTQLAVQMRAAGLTASAIKAGLSTAYAAAIADYQAVQAQNPPA
jgi:hypothetical protein